LERNEHRLEEVGLALREAKKLLGAIQQVYSVIGIYKGERFLLDFIDMDTTGKLGRGDK
jgi:hypothetical protein